MTAPLVRRFAANTRGRDLVVGDVHGCFTKLREDLAAVGFDQARDRLFSLGDLVDRGPESDQVLEWLGQSWFIAIAGNHEAMAVEYSAGTVDAGLYAMNGGAWLIGMTPPEKLPYVDAFRDLPIAVELETPAGLLGLVHADCPAPVWTQFTGRLEFGGLVQAAAIDAAQWSRGRIDFLQTDGVEGVLAVMVGHTPVQRFTSLGNVFYCDTGAWRQGGAIADRFVIIDAATLRPAVAPSLLDWGSNAPI